MCGLARGVAYNTTRCGPCRMISPVLEAISERHDGKIGFYKVDVDEQPVRSPTPLYPWDLED